MAQTFDLITKQNVQKMIEGIKIPSIPTFLTSSELTSSKLQSNSYALTSQAMLAAFYNYIVDSYMTYGSLGSYHGLSTQYEGSGNFSLNFFNKSSSKRNLRMVWGYVATGGSNVVNVSFSEAFSQRPCVVAATIGLNASTTYEHVNVYDITTSGFKYRRYDGYGLCYLAIGD